MDFTVKGENGFSGDVCTKLRGRFPEEDGRVSIDSRFEDTIVTAFPKSFQVTLVDAPEMFTSFGARELLRHSGLRIPTLGETLLFLCEHADNPALMAEEVEGRSIIFFHKPIAAFGGRLLQANQRSRGPVADRTPSYCTSLTSQKRLEEFRVKLFDTSGCIHKCSHVKPYLLAGVRI